MGEKLGFINILYRPQELDVTTCGKSERVKHCKLGEYTTGAKSHLENALKQRKYQYVFILIRVLELEVSCSHKNSFYGPHAIIVMELGGQLL